MSRKLWNKWAPQDWLGDPNLRLCSPSTRGIWMDIICLIETLPAHKGREGHLLMPEGQPMRAVEIAHVCGTDPVSVEAAFNELTRTQTCDRAQDGAIICRRIRRRLTRSRRQPRDEWDECGARSDRDRTETGAESDDTRNYRLEIDDVDVSAQRAEIMTICQPVLRHDMPVLTGLNHHIVQWARHDWSEVVLPAVRRAVAFLADRGDVLHSPLYLDRVVERYARDAERQEEESDGNRTNGGRTRGGQRPARTGRNRIDADLESIYESTRPTGPELAPGQD